VRWPAKRDTAFERLLNNQIGSAIRKRRRRFALPAQSKFTSPATRLATDQASGTNIAAEEKILLVRRLAV